MHRFLLALFLLLPLAAGAEVLIVADEFPAMEFVAGRLKSEEHVGSKLVSQKELPETLAPYEAVVVYIHGALAEKAENAFIAYAEGGGKLVLLHHSISSGKRKNAHWFPFLGVTLPEGDVSDGGYKWIEPATMELVNLNAGHFITTNQVSFPAEVPYTTTNTPVLGDHLPGFALEHSEVYLNHVHTAPHTHLLGLKYTDPKSGVTYMQDTAGWTKPAGKGWIVYLMAGHTQRDFENPTYQRMVLNAVVWKPRPVLTQP